MNKRDSDWLADLGRSHPTPLGVLMPRSAQARYFELLDAFQSVAPSVHVFYSVKTNPHPALLSSLNAMESGFECASLRELEAVSSFSRPLLLNAPASSDEEIRRALELNACIVLDSFSQAEQVARVAASKPTEVGVRLRLDKYRFGFSPEELPLVFSRLSELGLRVKLVHAHPGTSMTLSHYRSFISRVAEIIRLFPSVSFLDIGGGFPGKTTLLERKETITSYALIVKELLGEHLRSRTLFLESGRFLVEDSMIVLSRVMHVKKLEDTGFALLDAGINVLPRASLSPFRVTALSESGEKKAIFRLAGPLLFGSDEFSQLSAKLAVGDLVAIENTGAYCTELAWRLSRDPLTIHIVE